MLRNLGESACSGRTDLLQYVCQPCIVSRPGQRYHCCSATSLLLLKLLQRKGGSQYLVS